MAPSTPATAMKYSGEMRVNNIKAHTTADTR